MFSSQKHRRGPNAGNLTPPPVFSSSGVGGPPGRPHHSRGRALSPPACDDRPRLHRPHRAAEHLDGIPSVPCSAQPDVLPAPWASLLGPQYALMTAPVVRRNSQREAAYTGAGVSPPLAPEARGANASSFAEDSGSGRPDPKDACSIVGVSLPSLAHPS